MTNTDLFFVPSPHNMNSTSTSIEQLFEVISKDPWTKTEASSHKYSSRGTLYTITTTSLKLKCVTESDLHTNKLFLVHKDKVSTI